MLARVLAILLLVVQPLAAIATEVTLHRVQTPAVCCCCLVVLGQVVECRTGPCSPDQRPTICCRVDIAAVWSARAGVPEREERPTPDGSVPEARVAFRAIAGVSRPCGTSPPGTAPVRAAICVWVI